MDAVISSSDGFSLQDCTFKFSSVPPGERAMTYIKLAAHYPLDSGPSIASLTACKVVRRVCRPRFSDVMNEHDELHRLHVAVYDKLGYVRPWLIGEGNRSGTGCWGVELNDGEIICIVDIEVGEKYRGQGVGSMLLEKLATWDYIKAPAFLMCRPRLTDEGNASTGVVQDLKEKQISFFRNNGFCRIGRTAFFGYSTDPAHPCRLLPASADANELGIEFNTTEDDHLSPQELISKYPLHFIIANSKGPEAKLKNKVLHYYNLDPLSLHKTDASGMTPVHVAFTKMNPDAVASLLALGGASEMSNSHNVKGLTPLECLAEEMASSRDAAETLLGQWEGYSNAQLVCEFLGKHALYLPTMTYNLKEYVSKRKWGCTCGDCADGWLSKRMRFRLRVDAGLCKDAMHENMYLFKGNEVIHKASQRLVDLASYYLPVHLRHKSLTKTFYQGYQMVFDMAYVLLQTTDVPLTKKIVEQYITGEMQTEVFLVKGGEIEHAFDAITRIALDESCLVEGTFEDAWADQPEFTRLPTCENDLKFELVRRMLGLNPDLNWGPYFSDDSDGDDIEEAEIWESDWVSD